MTDLTVINLSLILLFYTICSLSSRSTKVSTPFLSLEPSEYLTTYNLYSTLNTLGKQEMILKSPIVRQNNQWQKMQQISI